MDAINSFLSGEELTQLNDRITLFTKTDPVNVKEARRRIANKLIEENR
jgi:hypothetical protein